MGKNHNTWSQRTKIIFREIKNIFHPLGSLFSHQSYRSLTGKRQRHSERITCKRPLQWPQPMWFLNVWENVPLDLKFVCQQYFTCMCFLGFIRYNKTFIACRFRKYDNVFNHEYSYFPRTLPWREYDTLGWKNFTFPSPACNKCIILVQ